VARRTNNIISSDSSFDSSESGSSGSDFDSDATEVDDECVLALVGDVRPHSPAVRSPSAADSIDLEVPPLAHSLATAMGLPQSWTPIAPTATSSSTTTSTTVTTLPEPRLGLSEFHSVGLGSWCWLNAHVAFVATLHSAGLVKADVDIAGSTVAVTHSVLRPTNERLRSVIPNLAMQSVPPLDHTVLEQLVGILNGCERCSATRTTFELPFDINCANVVALSEGRYKYLVLTRAVSSVHV